MDHITQKYFGLSETVAHSQTLSDSVRPTSVGYSERLKQVLPYALISSIGLILYSPFASRTLYHTDSVGFARAIHYFSIRLHQPQAPGFFLYVVSLRVLQFLSHLDDNTTIVVLSISATIIAANLFYVLTRSWFRPIEALLLSLLFLTGPVIWFNAEIAMSYPLGLLGSVAIGLAAYKTKQGSTLAPYALPVIWGLTGGYRLDVSLLLTPLVIYCIAHKCLHSKRYAVIFLALFLGAAAIWCVPLIYFAGGVRAYVDASRVKSLAATPLTSFKHNEFKEGMEYLAKGLAVLVVLCLINSLGLFGPLIRRLLSRTTDIKVAAPRLFLLLWCIPGLLFHELTVVGHSGHLLPYLPAAFLLVVLPQKKGEPATRRTISLSHASIIGGILLQSVFFLFSLQVRGVFSGHWIDDVLFRSTILEPTRSRLKSYDAVTGSLVAEVRAKYPSQNTVLITPEGGEEPDFNPPIRSFYGQAQYYLSDWSLRVVYTAKIGPNENPITQANTYAVVTNGKFQLRNSSQISVPEGTKWLVWFCDAKAQPYPFDATWTRYAVGPDVDMVMSDVGSNRKQLLRWGPFEFAPEISR